MERIDELIKEVAVENRFNLKDICLEEIKEFKEVVDWFNKLDISDMPRKKFVKAFEEVLGEVADIWVVKSQYDMYEDEMDFVFELELGEDYVATWSSLMKEHPFVKEIVRYKLERTLFRNKFGYYNKEDS